MEGLLGSLQTALQNQWQQGEPYRVAAGGLLSGDTQPMRGLLGAKTRMNPMTVDEAMALSMDWGPMALGTISGGKMASVLNQRHPHVDAYLMESPSSVTVSSIKVPENIRGKGHGTNFMNDLLGMADEQGKIVALTPSSDFGGNKSRLERWYKSLGFVTNKGPSKDFSISESMYRPPAKPAKP